MYNQRARLARPRAIRFSPAGAAYIRELSSLEAIQRSEHGHDQTGEKSPSTSRWLLPDAELNSSVPVSSVSPRLSSSACFLPPQTPISKQAGSIEAEENAVYTPVHRLSLESSELFGTWVEPSLGDRSETSSPTLIRGISLMHPSHAFGEDSSQPWRNAIPQADPEFDNMCCDLGKPRPRLYISRERTVLKYAPIHTPCFYDEDGNCFAPRTLEDSPLTLRAVEDPIQALHIASLPSPDTTGFETPVRMQPSRRNGRLFDIQDDRIERPCGGNKFWKSEDGFERVREMVAAMEMGPGEENVQPVDSEFSGPCAATGACVSGPKPLDE